MWLTLLGCRGSGMVEVPGSSVPGPSRTGEPTWSWPAAVPSLASCVWTEIGAAGDAVTWTYDASGHLVGSTEIRDGWTLQEAYTWRSGCLVERATYEPVRDADAGVASFHVYDCDPRDNPVAWDQFVIDADGRMDPATDGRRTFVNVYDALGQLSTVETWVPDDPDAGPAALDGYTWNADGRPLVQVRELPSDGARTTWTWWWDHDLLLGRDEVGTGADVYMTRTHEDRRLVEETVVADDAGTTVSRWAYPEPDAPFPNAREVTLPSSDPSVRNIDVDCVE